MAPVDATRVLARAHPPRRGHDLGDRQRAARLPHRPVPDHGARHQRQDALGRAADQRRRPVRDRRRRVGPEARAAARQGELPALGQPRRVPRAGRRASSTSPPRPATSGPRCWPTRSTGPPARSSTRTSRRPAGSARSTTAAATSTSPCTGRRSWPRRPTTPSSPPRSPRWPSALAADEATIAGELLAVQGSPADIGGYYRPDPAKTDGGDAPLAPRSTRRSPSSAGLDDDPAPPRVHGERVSWSSTWPSWRCGVSSRPPSSLRTGRCGSPDGVAVAPLRRRGRSLGRATRRRRGPLRALLGDPGGVLGGIDRGRRGLLHAGRGRRRRLLGPYRRRDGVVGELRRPAPHVLRRARGPPSTPSAPLTASAGPGSTRQILHGGHAALRDTTHRVTDAVHHARARSRGQVPRRCVGRTRMGMTRCQLLRGLQRLPHLGQRLAIELSPHLGEELAAPPPRRDDARSR